MSLRVGELHALLRVDDKQFQDGLRKGERNLRTFQKRIDDTVKRLDKLADRLNKVGKTMMTTVTTPLLAAGGAAVKLASDAEETAEKFNVSFGEMAAASLAMADQLAADLQRSSLQMRNFAADAQAILAPQVANREAAAEMSMALAALAVDLGSFLNMADREAFDRLISGLLGSTEATERLGISLRESTLQAEAQRLGIEGNVATWGDAEKIMIRFLAIMRQSTDAQGDAIRTGESFSNQLKALQADVVTLATEIGEMLLPRALGLVHGARQIVQNLRELSPETQQTIIRFGQMAAIAGPLTLALSSIVRGIAATGRALSLLTTVAKRNPWLLIAMGAGMAAMQIEEVREAAERLMRQLGLGGLLDTFDDLGAAWDELVEAVTSAEFKPQEADLEAYQRQMEEVAQRIGEVLRQTVAENLEEGVEEGAEEAGRTLLDELTEAFEQLPVTIDRAVNAEIVKRQMQETMGRIMPSFDEETFRRQLKIDLLSEMIEEAVLGGLENTRLFGQMIEAFIEEAWRPYASAGWLAQQALDAGVNFESTFRRLIGEPLTSVERFEMALDDLQRALREALEEGYDPNSSVIRRLVEEIEVFRGALERARITELIDEFHAALAGPGGLFPTLETSAQRRLFFWVDDLRYAEDRLSEIERLTQQFVWDMQTAGVPATEIVKHIEQAREEWMGLNREILHLRLQQARDEFERTMGIGMQFAEMMARAAGQAFDALDYRIEALQDKLQAQIRAAQEFADTLPSADQFDLLAGFVDPGIMVELERLWQQRLDRDFRRAIMDILDDLQRDIAQMDLLADLAFLRGEEFDRAESELRRLERAIIDANLALLTAGDVSDEVMAEMEAELDRLIRQYDELAASIDRSTNRIAELLDELERDLTVRMAVEHLIASATGASFDPVEYERRAIERTINQIVDEMLRAGEGIGAIRDEIEPLLERLRGLRTETGWLERMLARAADTAQRLGIELLSDLDPLDQLVAIMRRAIPTGEILQGAMEALAQESAALEGPLRAFGYALGSLIEPVIVALEPWLRLLAEAALGLAIALVQLRLKALELFLNLAKAIDALPFVSAKTAIRQLEQAIAEQEKRYDDLIKAQERLRNGMDEAAEAALGFSRNVPRIFRVALERFRAADITNLRNIPALATGGFVPPTPGGQIVRLAEAGEGEFVIPASRMGDFGGGGDIIINVNAPVYGVDHLKRVVRQAVSEGERRRSTARYGR